MDTSLVIMAAGIGSRFGGGTKQLAEVGPEGQIIMDYSIFDAVEAGFNKVVFIIRKDLEAEFREIVGNKTEKICKVEYAFQELDNLPNGHKLPANRTKPWGTGQAVLAAKNCINEPFVVINADDYYGKEAFQMAHKFLVENPNAKTDYCMVGYILNNTLSNNGGVSRGVIQVDENNFLVDIVETHNITKVESGAEIVNENSATPIDVNSKVSMNMWGMSCDFLEVLEEKFTNFLEETSPEDLKSEFLLPLVIGNMVKETSVTVKVLETNDTWFGVTYKEDKDGVIQEFRKLVEKGIYKKDL